MDKQIVLNDEAYEELLALSRALGFAPEMAARYAVRLVSACMREGLLTDTRESLWPEEAQAGIAALRADGGRGKVLLFPGAKTSSCV